MKVSVITMLVLVGVACCMASESQGRASGYHKYYSKPSTKTKDQSEVGSSFSFMKIVTFLVNMFFGAGDKSDSGDNSATSRQIFNLMMTAIDFLQNTFKQRSAGYLARGTPSTLDDGILATLHLLKGLVRSSVASNSVCQQRYICEANRMATQSGSVGYMVSQVST